MDEQKEFVKQIKDKIDRSIHIKRVPRHTRSWFLDYANDYFEGDYGCCLKHIVDTFRGMTPIGYEELQVQVDELYGLVNARQDKEVVIGKKMANGMIRTRSE